MGVGLIDKKQVSLIAQESRSLGVMFYIAGVLYGILFTGSRPPTQPVGSLLMTISGGWIVWSVFRQPPPALQQHKQEA